MAGIQSSKYEYNILDYGATRDGNSLNTAAINKAIKTCAESGGGTVIIPPGKYLSGPIEILSNVTLHLESGATIKGSSKLEDYAIEQGRASGESARAGLVTARDANNIAITGGGVIDGSGMDFVYPDRIHTGSDYDKKFTRQKEDFMNPKYGTQHGPLAHGERPGNLVRFLNCRGVLISGVTIQDSPTWTVKIARCRNVSVIGININISRCCSFCSLVTALPIVLVDIFCWMTIVTTMMRGRMFMLFPIRGNDTGILTASGDERSFIHKNLVLRSSMDFISAW